MMKSWIIGLYFLKIIYLLWLFLNVDALPYAQQLTVESKWQK
jgi:hypothetical protein